MASCGTLSVESPFQETAVFVTSCPTPSSGEPDSQQTVTVTVQNNNISDARATLTATVNGSSIGSTSVIASGGETTHDVPITLPGEPGDYSLDISVTSASAASTSAAFVPGVDGARRALSDRRTLLTAGAGLGSLGLAALSSRR